MHTRKVNSCDLLHVKQTVPYLRLCSSKKMVLPMLPSVSGLVNDTFQISFYVMISDWKCVG